MRVGIDLSAAVHRRAGLGRYTQELATALRRVAADTEFVGFYNRAAGAQPIPELEGWQKIAMDRGDKPWRLQVLAAHALGWPQDRLVGGVDVFHGTDHLLPRLRHTASVFTLYDVTHRRVPDTHSSLNRRYLDLMLPRFLEADAVVAISHASARDIEQEYGIDRSNIDVVHSGVNPRFSPADHQAIQRVVSKYRLHRAYLLFVGTIEPRKNLVTLLEAMARIKRSNPAHTPPLVVVGRKGWKSEAFFERMVALGLEDDIILPGFVPDEDLIPLYSGASLFCYPSLYEGFGLPVLEAMACGTPVVCSNTSSLPEVAGDAAIMVDPDDSAALAEAIQRVLGDHALAEDMRDRGLSHAAQFTWDRAAQQMLTIYHRVARHAHEEAR